MEEAPFDDGSARWSKPRLCRRCHYPMAGGSEACPACRRPARLLSSLSGQMLLRRSRHLGGQLWSLLQAVVMLVLGLTVAYYLSPLLLLFPLVALSADPPASRGGKTVSHGRRRSR